MPSLLRRVFRRAKRRIKEGLRDGKTFSLYRAGCHLLSRQDHEQVSVAQIAQAAEISVGAFYQRFPNKESYLGMVVMQRLNGTRERMEWELRPERWQHKSAAAVTRAIVEEMIRGLHGPGAGVVRTALKRGHLDRTKLEPLFRYRKALSDRAAVLLSSRMDGVRNPDRAVRIAMQIAEATALDALLHGDGPLRPGSRRMAAALSTMVLSMLGLTGDTTESLEHAEDEVQEAGDKDGWEDMLEMRVEEVTALAVPEAPRQRRKQKDPETGPVKVLHPARATKPQEEQEPEPPRQRRRPKF